MSNGRWNLDAEPEDDTSSERPAPTLVSMHFIQTALRRRRLACVLAGVLGLLAAGAFLLVFPLPQQARSTLVLAYDPAVDPSRAMATNVSLLQTRTVAAQVIDELDLAMPPEDFLKSFVVVAESSDLMTLTLSAPTDAEAVRRLEGLTAVYLRFRAAQLSQQSQTFTTGLQVRIGELQKDAQQLSTEIDRLREQGSEANRNRLDELVTQRSYVNDRVQALQQQVEDTTLRNSSVVASSRIVDPPAALPGLAKRTVALILASGLIGGTAIGCGTVLFFAITSDKLRRRADVAAALGVPVAVSIGRITPVSALWRWLPPIAAVDRRRAGNRQRLTRAVEDELLARTPARIVVAGLDSTAELGTAVADLAAGLAARDHPTTVLDLTEQGSETLTAALWASGQAVGPSVLRPRGVPALAQSAGDLLPVGHWDDGDGALPVPLSDVVLVLADLDPSVGVDHLTEWADRVVLVVTAGRSSVEKIRTVSEMLRDAGLDLRFAVLLRTERTDESSGLAPLENPAPVPLREPAQPAAPAAARTEAR